MNKEDPFNLRPLWDVILDIYKVYADICNRHNLRYYLCAGSVLGALRHGGFIPWDDDFDVIMPRPDYERFREIAKTELKWPLKWMDRKNTPEFRCLFGKIMDCRKERIEELESKVGHMLSNGLFIDVFPLDGYPETKCARMISFVKEWMWLFYFRFLTRSERPPARTLTGKFATAGGALLAPFFGFKGMTEIIDLAESYLRRIPFSDDKISGAGGCLVGKFERVIPPHIWGNPRMAKFEGIDMPIPEHAEDLMRNFYGDYMKLPPEDKRKPTHEYAARCPWCFGPTSE